MKIKRKIFLIIITNIMIFFTFATSSYAKLENYLYQNNDREYYYILTKNYSKINKADIEDYMYEEIYDNMIFESLEPDAVNSSTWDYKYYFYFWLHGVSDMIDYIRDTGIDYQVLSGESKENLDAAIAVLDYTKHELGTFTVAMNDLPTDVTLFHGGDRITQKKTRSLDAYGDITGTHMGYQTPEDGIIVDGFEKKVNSAIRELQAAYDYKTGEDKYAEGGVSIKDDFETKKNYSATQVKQYIDAYGGRTNTSTDAEREELLKIWEEKVGEPLSDVINQYDIDTSTSEIDKENAERIVEEKKEKNDPDANTIFKNPQNLGREEDNQDGNGINGAISDAEKLVTSTGETKEIFSEQDMADFSNSIYNILLSVGIVIAVVVGMILGVKLMLAPIDERAEAKKLLIPYAVGCAIIFGAFGIWKLAVIILQNV